MAGFDFPGTAPTMTMYQAIAEIDHPERLSGGLRHTSGGMFALTGFYPGGWSCWTSAVRRKIGRRRSHARRSKPCCAGSAARTSV